MPRKINTRKKQQAAKKAEAWAALSPRARRQAELERELEKARQQEGGPLNPVAYGAIVASLIR
jgi:hypothetical protein